MHQNQILEIKVDEGDNVKKGDIIATVEAENIEAKLEQAKALVGIAQTRVGVIINCWTQMFRLV